jgi:hypothetical protein
VPGGQSVAELLTSANGRYGVAGLEVLARAVRDATPPAGNVIAIGVTADAVHEVVARHPRHPLINNAIGGLHQYAGSHGRGRGLQR